MMRPLSIPIITSKDESSYTNSMQLQIYDTPVHTYVNTGPERNFRMKSFLFNISNNTFMM